MSRVEVYFLSCFVDLFAIDNPNPLKAFETLDMEKIRTFRHSLFFAIRHSAIEQVNIFFSEY